MLVFGRFGSPMEERAKSYGARKWCDAIRGVVTGGTLVRGRSLDLVDNKHLNWALGRFQF